MRNGSKYTMPIIVLSLGGEMLYILNQRLQAQNIADEKAKKVLQDVVKAMFSPSFIEELFKPQEIYSLVSTKLVFEKLAHSSIMRLNQSSMDKLFDLMTMGFKFQVLQCNSPQQYLHLLLVHLESIQQLLGKSVVSDLAQTAIDKAIDIYSAFTFSNWIELKHSLYNFVQGKRIKVSLFLQHKMQSLDGYLLVDGNEKVPKGTDIPGHITFFEAGNEVSKTNFKTVPKDLILCPTVLDAKSSIGINMYVKSYKPVAELDDSCQSSLRAMKAMDSSTSMPKSSFAHPESSPAKSAKLELNMLADILGVGEASAMDKSSHVPLQINLFPEFAADSKAGSSSSSSGGFDHDAFIMIDIDGAADSKTVQQYMERLGLNGDSKSAGTDSKEEDDLLSLMDTAK